MAADPTTWTELKAAVKDWTNRDDLDAAIPGFIALAERGFQRGVFTPDRETETVLEAAAEVALPADLWQIRAAYVDADPKVTLEPMSLSELRIAHASAATGRPSHYALLGGTMLLGPAPDAAYDIKLAYVRTIPPLGEDCPSNWLLEAHPDLYVAGALVEAHAWTRDAEGLAIWKVRLDEKIETVNRAGRRRAYGQAPQRLRAPVVV